MAAIFKGLKKVKRSTVRGSFGGIYAEDVDGNEIACITALSGEAACGTYFTVYVNGVESRYLRPPKPIRDGMEILAFCGFLVIDDPAIDDPVVGRASLCHTADALLAMAGVCRKGGMG